MSLLPSSTDAWEHLTSWYRQWNVPIQIFVTHDADAAAGLHTLMSLLRTIRVLFEVHSIITTQEMRAIVNKTHADLGFPEDPSEETPLADGEVDEEGTPEAYFFCLGCGAQADLASVFRNFRHSRVHVLDAHRPVFLGNLTNRSLFLESKLFIWNHALILEMIDAFFRQQRIRLKKKRRREERAMMGGGDAEEDFGDSADEDDFDADEDDDGQGDGSILSRLWLRDLSTVPFDIVEVYYSSLACGRSVALDLSDFSVLVNRHQDDYTWSAAVGVTDLYMRRLCDRVSYSVEMLKLRDAVNRRRVAGGAATSSSAAAAEQVTLRSAFEYPAFFMLRHWSLWCALMYQPEVCNALELFTDSGEARLQSLLAECGVSRKVADRAWAELSQEERGRILPLLAEILKECVPEFTTNTVSRSVGFSVEITAFDACRLFNAIIASAVSPHDAAALPNTLAPTDASALTVTQRVTGQLATAQRSLFWKAHEVLMTTSHSKLFREALEEAKSLQRDISLATSSLFVQRGALYTTKTMYYSPVTERTSQTVETFWTPARLMALSDAVVQTLTVTKTRQRQANILRPLVLACAIPPVICEAAKKAGQGSDAPSGLSGAVGGEQRQFLIVYAHVMRVLKSRPFQPMPVAHHLKACVEGFLKEDEEAARALRLQQQQQEQLTTPASGGGFIDLDGVEGRWLVVTGQDRTNHLVESIHLSLNSAYTSGLI